MKQQICRLSAIAAIAVFATALGACGSDDPAAGPGSGSVVEGAPAPSPTDTPEAPAPTDAPAATDPAPQPTAAPAPTTPESGDTDSDDNDWVLPLLLIGGLLLAAVIIGGVIGRSKKSAAQPAATSTSTSSPQASLLSTSQWITDQLSLELMAAPPDAAQQRWAVERSRLDNVAMGAQQQYLEVQDANWQPLAQNMSALAAAIDTNLALRAQDPPNAQLIGDSTDVINRHRATLQQLIAALRQTTPR